MIAKAAQNALYSGRMFAVVSGDLETIELGSQLVLSACAEANLAFK
jgi:hypothetical protein